MDFVPVIGKADNVADISFNGRLLNHQVAQLMALYVSQSDMAAALGKLPLLPNRWYFPSGSKC
ncbi:Uncharacterised protein [Neisseria gonorrhoeae]|uniref:Uncharacterized protein n=1 Tax=Neisseria gonorrhoeae TaxID=485 RepID=A0A378W1W1_NEIGO|nr:Uncharacterised protein [Neisseria gonorrhoeae]